MTVVRLLDMPCNRVEIVVKHSGGRAVDPDQQDPTRTEIRQDGGDVTADVVLKGNTGRDGSGRTAEDGCSNCLAFSLAEMLVIDGLIETIAGDKDVMGGEISGGRQRAPERAAIFGIVDGERPPARRMLLVSSVRASIWAGMVARFATYLLRHRHSEKR